MNRFLEIPDNPVTVLLRPQISRWKLYKWYSYFGSKEPALGLLYIASNISSNGYNVKVLDGEKITNKGILSELISIKPDIIGITSTTFSFFNSASLMNQLSKEFPDSLMLMGGPHVTALPEDTLNRLNFLDGVVVGDGEETLLEIIKKRKTEEIDGLVWRQNSDSKIILNKKRDLIGDLDKYQLDWRLLDGFPDKYLPPFQNRRSRSVALVISRGCYYSCSFCASNHLYGKKIRYHSPAYVINEMTRLENLYKINDFYFHDDYLPANSDWILKFCNTLLSLEKQYTWSCSSRVELLTNDILALMKKSGCRQIGVGVESASQKVLDQISKKIAVRVLNDGLQRISSSKIQLKGLFILDTPGETLRDILKTLKMIFFIRFSQIQFNYYVPLPGSRDYLKYNPDSNLWGKMSLQHCLGYSKINPIFYPIIEVTLYMVSYIKIFINNTLKKKRFSYLVKKQR